MGFLRDLFVGKNENETIEGTFWDARIGALSARVDRERPEAWCSWQGQHVIAGQTRATRFRLSGDSRGPHAGLLVQTHRVLDALEAIGDKANALLRACGDGSSFCDFYLSVISDWDEHDEILELEFLPVDGAVVIGGDRRICWPEEDELANHHVVLRAGSRG